MAVSPRRVWRAAPLTLVVVWLFTVVAAIGIPTLGYLLYVSQAGVALPSVLAATSVATVIYAWRYGLHPRLLATADELVVYNPWRRHHLSWRDITLVAPGENGLLVGTEDVLVEAWCVQKSSSATRQLRRTRADTVTAELLDLIELHQPPVVDSSGRLAIRRARPDESRMLTRMERAASEAKLGLVFAPDVPYPTAEVRRRWAGLLRDRLVTIRVLEVDGEPAGYLAYDTETVRHLGVLPEQMRRGYGSWLLAFATADLFERGVAAARLWVLTENLTARHFYTARGWRESGRRRECEFPPYPEELELARENPIAPRRAVTSEAVEDFGRARMRPQR